MIPVTYLASEGFCRDFWTFQKGLFTPPVAMLASAPTSRTQVLTDNTRSNVNRYYSAGLSRAELANDSKLIASQTLAVAKFTEELPQIPFAEDAEIRRNSRSSMHI